MSYLQDLGCLAGTRRMFGFRKKSKKDHSILVPISKLLYAIV